MKPMDDDADFQLDANLVFFVFSSLFLCLFWLSQNVSKNMIRLN